MAHYEKAQSFEGFSGVEKISNSDLLELDLRHPDPGRNENQPSGQEHAAISGAKIIVEGRQRADDAARG
jgi:hypothetical protein